MRNLWLLGRTTYRLRVQLIDWCAQCTFYPFVWHLALFVLGALGALGASAWVSMLQAS